MCRQLWRPGLPAAGRGARRFANMAEPLAGGQGVAGLSRIFFGRFKPEKSLFSKSSKSYVRPDARLGDGTDYRSLPGGFDVA